ncbi:VapC toxin family PIN domain ribonuclease [Candidatus Desantisbacteria bacterium CG_4_10_14_0_8_um_filter_48_22]|uniref:Ribonuclease VapC n=1 Tax=Candidatus Desantisbacteria bacterium CG_4_10_14_0_8_um_filter_48_22 TaxID=1974543 RepID=A0A2M7S9U8_9BACT|nr:MAG: hypothetical protein AUJ67_04145 [Candidatus Desantisbacteria bacterium CG1_02_49_89]PIV56958.1 MAG: VapC toxin family PIN domain ribonuclease [Candidatus Desantisbacteria bacterium CG02_land_8_20_14_3_00_49_13]PIZ16218.1 MAG: VapC toxin family PIN domain ribonuclease [Candidatus Desantisbacteria bacterium CG_4_10_14_0_8_um_filter_48_22]
MAENNGSSYVLDTSAILAFLEDEPGADVVERLLKQAGSRKFRVFASFMSFMECFYHVYMEQGEESAKKVYMNLKTLPIHRVDADEELILIAGSIKANFRLSVADSWIIATAKKKNAKLVHKDPEFEQVGKEVILLSLPYK